MNYIGLWIRLIWIILICLIAILFVFALIKKYKLKTKLIFSFLIIATFYFFGIMPVINSIVHPDIKNFTGTYLGFSYGVTRTSPLQAEHCFDVDGTKMYVESDLISEKFLFKGPLKEGLNYKIYYEAEQNLIISVEKKQD